MLRKKIIEKIQNWKPKRQDAFGEDKLRFIRYMSENCSGIANANSIQNIIHSISFQRKYTKESFQHHIIVPLREEDDIFVGTSSKGIFLVQDASDVQATMDFYTKRIRSEHAHLRNLKRIARKNGLVKNQVTSNEPLKTTIFFDESGTPSLSDRDTNPFFIVSAIIFNHKNPDKLLKKRFSFIRSELGLPGNYEFKSTRLRPKQYKRILKELTPVEYEAACICFVKKKLTGKGFNHPTSFYKFAFQYLVGDLLDYVGGANLYFDEYSSGKSKFKREFLDYIRKRNAPFIYNRMEKIEMIESSKSPSAQMADLVAGVFKWKLLNKVDIYQLIDEKIVFVRYFPPL
jgi:hypothetical protein